MPSGQTHDSITLWSLPLIAGITFERTRSSSLTLLVAGGFLFSGLMFGPDLDTHSQQFRRWGVFRWIWLPYRKSIRHRSLWSHGPIVGTIVRTAYLLIWLGMFAGLAVSSGAIGCQVAGLTSNWLVLAQQGFDSGTALLGRSLQQHPAEWIGFGIGLELGGLSHSISDWIGSAYKRLHKRRQKKSSFAHRSPELIEPNSQLPAPAQSTAPPPLRRTLELPTFKPPIKD